MHYIDDFIFIGTSKADVEEQVRRFEIVCAAFGIPVKEEKNVGPAQHLTCRAALQSKIQQLISTDICTVLRGVKIQ